MAPFFFFFSTFAHPCGGWSDSPPPISGVSSPPAANFPVSNFPPGRDVGGGRAWGLRKFIVIVDIILIPPPPPPRNVP